MRIVPGSKPPSERAPRRMEELAVLPVFLRLKGRRAVVAGGSDAAAWKAELLAAAGAEIHVYAPGDGMGETMRALIADDARFVHHDRPWAGDCFRDAGVAVADAETDGAAKAFFCAARAAGVPVNVIDKPAFCQFQFGSVVNRSPVVVGISTDGAAPVLGQAIRRRIETLLPPSIAAWGRIARDIRGAVMERLAPGGARRAFWEDFVDHAFARPPGPDAAEEMAACTRQVAANADRGMGRVTLVGAGPGDAEYLTLKAVRALQAADVILFDSLVSGEVLEIARREARRMLVGKRGGRASCRQEDVNDMMVTFARAGKHVVRLKSGDPMIFGRAGEEIARLDAHGIPVEIVPGITSALAMAARLKVSLTHRDCAQSVRFVTGHARDGRLPAGHDWQGLGDPNTTTVYYMAGRTAEALAARLMASGLPADTPVAVVSALSRPNEAVAATRLDDLARQVLRLGTDEPILIGVGRVFAGMRAASGDWGSPHEMTERGESPGRSFAH